MKKRIMSALLAVCLVLTAIPNLAIAARATNAEAPGMVKGHASGTVADAKTGAGISGVTVNAYTTSGTLTASTTTDSSGKYKIETDPGGVFTLEFVRSGYTTGRLEGVLLGVLETTHDMQLIPSGGGESQGGGSPDNPSQTEVVGSGTCGENVTWSLDSNGLLTIFGEIGRAHV